MIITGSCINPIRIIILMEGGALAKDSYKIAPALNRSFLEHEIAMPVPGFDSRPTSIKQLLFYLAGLLVIMWATTSTFIKSAGVLWIVLFVAWSVSVVVYLGLMSRTKQLKAETLPTLVNYIPRTSRIVVTRRSANPTAFASIVGIESIAPDGRITFFDGGAGQLYSIVGSASYLLFDEDRTAIINRVDFFWRNVPPSAEFIIITTKEPQRVYRQIAGLERRNQRLAADPVAGSDPDLLALQSEQYGILHDYVGGRFSSIQQYMLVRGKSPDALRAGCIQLEAEIESSSLMIKEASKLDREATQTLLATLYQESDSFALPTPTLAGGES